MWPSIGEKQLLVAKREQSVSTTVVETIVYQEPLGNASLHQGRDFPETIDEAEQ